MTAELDLSPLPTPLSTLTPAEAPLMTRRRVIQSAAIATAGLVIDPALRAAAYAQGSDKPEKEEVRIGFIPLAITTLAQSVSGMKPMRTSSFSGLSLPCA